MKIALWICLGIISPFLLYILLVLAGAALVNPRKEYKKNSKFYRFLLNVATVVCIKATRVRVRTTGLEKLPSGRFLFVCNHRSVFDPIVAMYVMRRQNLAFLSKEENFSIFAFGRIIRRCCFLPIDRKDPQKALGAIERAAECMQRDEVSFGVYPEGTRNRENRLLPFHSCVFKIAQKAGMPVVVACVWGTDKILSGPLHRRPIVRLDILDVLSPEEVKDKQTGKIGERIRTEMEEKLSEYTDGESAEIRIGGEEQPEGNGYVAPSG